MKRFMFFLLVLLLVPLVSADHGSMKLLAVSEKNGNIEGSIASLELDVERGRGRVFIDTFPLTQLDTQISTRFAKEITCDFLDRDCGYTDFFYTIRSNSPLIGGPSAGASIAVLTASVIEGFEIDHSVAITGTINSGGIIGPVSGIKEKIEAAHEEGLRKVLVPTRYVNEDNDTIDLINYGERLGIEVVEVNTLNQAIYEFTGKIYDEKDGEVKASDVYDKTMSNIVDNMCSRTAELKVENVSQAENLTERAMKALDKGKSYSAASLCFGANIRYRYNALRRDNLTSGDIKEKLTEVRKDLDDAYSSLAERDIETILDLQAQMIVRERLIGTKEKLDVTSDLLSQNRTDDALYNLAYSGERLKSSEYWSEFFDKGGKKVGEADLRESCVKKIGEARERIEYVKYFMPSLERSYGDRLAYAREDLSSGDYSLCLFKASKTKAEVDVVINALGLREGDTNSLIDSKLDIAGGMIIDQQKKGSFPLLGYSYYEYAKYLKEQDPSSALLYSEYAVELSQLDMYFGREGKPYFVINKELILHFILGILSGLGIGFLFHRYSKRKGKNPRKVP
ncbi:MAG: S16 family serine protease [Nanobdellota archaeon]